MNTEFHVGMNDVQSYKDARDIEITKVGIKGLKLPLSFINGGNENNTVMEAEFTVNLQATQKGTHMSRFIETWQQLEKPFSLSSVKMMLELLQKNLESNDAQCKLAFPLFFEREAPISKAKSVMDFACEIEAKLNPEYYELSLMAPVTSLCPCSKEISEFSAHSQRSHLTINLRFKDAESFGSFDIDATLQAMESVASSKLYPLLKRPDEKYVTETAYKNPRFVEDLVRDLVLLLKDRTDLDSFSVESENYESIHNHQAYAKIDYSFG